MCRSSGFLFAAVVFVGLSNRLLAQSVTTVQAETGLLSGGASVATSYSGYSGSGYVGGFTTGQGFDTMTVDVPSAGLYDLWIRYATPWGLKYANVNVNGTAQQIELDSAQQWSDADMGPVNLLNGENTVSIGGDWGWYYIDSITVSPVIHIEAESAILSGGAKIDTALAGYSGPGYVDGFTVNEGYAKFTGIQAAPGLYQLMVRYASPDGLTHAIARVDGVSMNIALPADGGFAVTAAGAVTLSSGSNTVVIGGGSGGYDLDYIELRPIYRFEAEGGVLSGSATVQSDPNASGGEYVQIDAPTVQVGGATVESAATVSANVPPGMYDVEIGYKSPNGNKGVTIAAGGLDLSPMLTSASWSVVDAGKVIMDAANNAITVGGGWGWYDIDYVALVPAAPDAPPKPVPDVLSDPNATPQAYELFDYLRGLYGSGNMISGQHNFGEFPYIESNTGRQPALLGVDFIDYSPSRTYFQGAPNPDPTLQTLQQEASSGNIIAAMWHWNAPADLINSPSEEWWSGFYTAATTFNVAEALDHPGSNDYKLLLSNMDTIASHLQQFDQAGVPVLWRPFHEASGGWFWWGAQGKAPFIKLWHLMYDRFTGPIWNLHNLIWVFGGSDPSWYPGSNYVDIVGADLYTTENDPTTASWDQYKQAFDGKKMIALTEFGGVPDVGMMDEFGVDWSYFMCWPGYEEKIPTSQLSVLYNSPEMVNQDTLPTWNFVAPTTPTTRVALSGKQNANPNGWYSGPVTLTLTASDTNTITATHYTVDGGPVELYTAPFVVSGDGRHTVEFWSADAAGNIESPKTQTLLMDSVAPKTVFAAALPKANLFGWHNSAVTVAYASSDATSGISVTPTTGTLMFGSEGAKQVQTVTQVDVAGNSSTVSCPPVSIDMTAPTTTASVVGARVTLKASDNLSGVWHMYYSVDSGAPSVYTGPFKVSAPGTHVVAYWSEDRAGNVEAQQTVTVIGG